MNRFLFFVLLSVVFISFSCSHECVCTTTYTTSGVEVAPSVTRTQEVSGGSCSDADLTLTDKDANIVAATVCK